MRSCFAACTVRSVMNAQKNIITIGGGTGTFVVLSGLKHLPNVSLSAIVSVADDGGSTGRLRDAYGFLPVGDARQALVALAGDNGESALRSLFMHRFSKGDIQGHNFGNLFLTALTEILGSDVAAIEAASKILQVRGRVLPASETAPTLIARLEDGTTVVGEHNIDMPAPDRAPITELATEKSTPAYHGALDAISGADLIILGPGDLYASVAANLVVHGIKEAIVASPAKLAYIVNLFSKSGQTDGYTASQCVKEITRYAGRAPDYVIMNSGAIPESAVTHYAREREYPTVDDLGNSPGVVRSNIVSATLLKGDATDPIQRSLVRHNPEKIATIIQTLL